MADRFAPHEYTCDCGGPRLKIYVWDSELLKQEFTCPACDKVLNHSNIKEDKKSSLIAIRTPTKNR